MKSVFFIGCVLGLCCSSAFGGGNQREIALSVSSGEIRMLENVDADGVVADRPQHVVGWKTEIGVEDSEWVRVRFGEIVLSPSTKHSRASYLRVTSLLDGYVQYLDAQGLREWRDTSAYFNGPTVLVELMVSAGSDQGVSRVEIVGVMASEPIQSNRSLCGADDRVVSSDPRVGRLMPIECTAWLVGTQGRCMITAGHCDLGNGGDVVQFNVPLSSITGTPMHPGPEDQYPVDPASIQDTAGATGLGNDWGFFGVFDNANTGLSALAAQGASYTLATQMPSLDGRSIRITGYGLTSAPMPATLNLVQKTDAGALVDIASTIVTYAVDSTGGNSGGAALDAVTGEVIAIHTNGRCDGIGGNQGTSVLNTGLLAAMADPRGICLPQGLVLGLVGNNPMMIDPAGGDAVSITVAPGDGVVPNGVVSMYIDSGTGYSSVQMTPSGGGVYEGLFPAIACPAVVRYYFEADGTDGSVWVLPRDGAAAAFETVSAVDQFVSITDSFEKDIGWSVSDFGVGTGTWERGVPGDFDRNDPVSDFDGSGQCFVTGNSFGEDVDSGTTVLLSPVFDLLGLDGPMVGFACWFYNDDGDDFLRVEFSDDGGGSWVDIESISTTNGWNQKVFAVDEYVAVTDSFRVRFLVADSPNNSVTEGAIDAFVISSLVCEPVCDADLDQNGNLNLQDVFAFLGFFNAQDPAGDLAEPMGVLNLQDIFAYLALFNAGCP